MLTDIRISYDGEEVSIDLTETGTGVLTPKRLRKEWVKGLFIDEQNGDTSGFVPDTELWTTGYKLIHNSLLLKYFIGIPQGVGGGFDSALVNTELLEEWIDGIRSNDFPEQAVDGWLLHAGLTPFHEMADMYIGEFMDTSDFVRDRLESEIGFSRIPGWLEWDSEACWDNLRDEYFEVNGYYFNKS